MATSDAITCVIPVHNPGNALEPAVNRWVDALQRLGRPFEILLVNDGSTDDATAKFAKSPTVRVLSHESRRGFGACLRTALAETQHPLFFYTAVDEPYAASDLRKLAERIDVRDEITGQSPVLVSGCRTARTRPGFVRFASSLWRGFCRLVLGLPLPVSPAWLGARETAYSYLVWAVFGVPLVDPNSAFKLWRTDFLRRFPIQSDGDFVHVELVAKATFLTTILDEVPLLPGVPRALPRRDVWRDFWRLLRNPDFGRPVKAEAA